MVETNMWHWTRLAGEDIPAVLRLIEEVEDADASPIRTTRQEVESYFSDSHLWRAQGAWVDNQLVCFGFARTPKENSGDGAITISGGVAKKWRFKGLGTELMHRQVETARDLAESAGIPKARVIMYIESAQDGLAELAEAFGFVRNSSFIQMRRELGGERNLETSSPYMEIVSMTDQLAKEVRRAHNRLLGDDGPWTKITKSAWKARLDELERDWCLVAIDRFGDRPRLAGYLLSSRFSSTIDGVESEEGYVEEIVVLPEWRGKHLATGLIGAAMDRFEEAGMRYIGIDVSVSYPQQEQATLANLFEHFEFERVSETIIVQMDLT